MRKPIRFPVWKLLSFQTVFSHARQAGGRSAAEVNATLLDFLARLDESTASAS
ncbi:hypothetical protein ACFYM3_36445 [Streptomyces massasporeus]|uniref:Uncharacterized protein n=1 Tax=Streptomyces massasporeus TaxID=67324 RepID=A0ABW6LPD1_9ACTN